MEDSKYSPYTQAEYIQLVEVLQSITTHIPDDRMGWIWSNHNKISKTQEPQPCACGSSAGHWRRAVDTIRNFIKQVESTNV